MFIKVLKMNVVNHTRIINIHNILTVMLHNVLYYIIKYT